MKDGRTPFGLALEYGHKEMVATFIELVAFMDFENEATHSRKIGTILKLFRDCEEEDLAISNLIMEDDHRILTESFSEVSGLIPCSFSLFVDFLRHICFQ